MKDNKPSLLPFLKGALCSPPPVSNQELQMHHTGLFLSHHSIPLKEHWAKSNYRKINISHGKNVRRRQRQSLLQKALSLLLTSFKNKTISVYHPCLGFGFFFLVAFALPILESGGWVDKMETGARRTVLK